MKLSILFLFIVFQTFYGFTAQAAIIYVDDKGTGDYATIQDAVNAASPGDVIVLQPGTYTGNGNRDIDFLGKAITVRGTNPDDPDVVSATIIDCQSTHRGFSFSNDEGLNSILSGLKIVNGYAPELGGGGILCWESSPTISNCIFQANTSIEGMTAVGGGVSCWYSYAEIKNCTFIENYAGAGGGIHIYDGRPTITDCAFRLNSSSTGGAMFVSDTIGLTLVTGCTFSENSSVYHGGGVFSQRSDLEITNSMFSGNSSEQWYGSGASDVAALTNCTFVGNTAGVGGGGTANWNINLTITNCILWGNSDAGGIDESAQMDNHTTTNINYSCVQGWTGGWGGTGNIDADPCFIAPHADDFHLMSDSPCIDAGDPSYVQEPNETDLDGNPRVIDGRIDMGAYEFQNQQNTAPVATAGPDQTVYAWIDGIAEVNLDGSGSYDEDGNELTYLWSWSIDGNTYDTNGIDPVIELPLRQHIITLVVNDGTVDSEPNDVNITVVAPVEGNLNIVPRILNCRSRQRRIMAMLRLPRGITRDQIDTNEPILLFPGEIEADWVWGSRYFGYKYRAWRTTILALFDKDELMDVIEDNGPVEITVVGQLITGQYFFGTDEIMVICPRKWPWRHPWWNCRCLKPI